MKNILLIPVRALKKVTSLAAHKVAKRIPGAPELVSGPLTYNQDGLATVHNADFLQDEQFLEAYRLGERTNSWGQGAQIQWRVYVACWAAQKATRLEGDFVECGVNRGGMSRAIMHFVNFPKLDKTFYLLDTFHGLEDRYISEAERARGIRSGGYDECYDAVCKTFEGFRTVIVRGPVPETLPQVRAGKLCYLSIDMNCAAPEISAAEYFWDRLVSGAVMVLDDYGWPGHYEQKVAFDRFAQQKGVMVLALPTGQGLIIKP